ncbi:MAG: GldG family protein, partial [Clostridia bacterium]|nr:GldG family protein [Clostridia bacterium]
MKFFEFLKDKRAAYGGYAAALTVGVIILVMLLNLLLTAAEGAFDLRQDLTAGRIYTLTKTTRKVLDNLEEDIIIYTLYQPGNEDSVVAKAVSKYAGPHVSVQNFDPVREPNTARHFQDTSYGMPQRGWLIVSNAAKTKFRVLRNDPPPKESDLFRYDQETGEILFLCEQQVTAAILYIVNNDNPAAWF